jgi:tetratricopeptide (TPR) repeat protein
MEGKEEEKNINNSKESEKSEAISNCEEKKTTSSTVRFKFEKEEKERPADEFIDVTEIEIIESVCLIPDSTCVIKKIVERGVGPVADFESTVWYSYEARFNNGQLCNIRDNRKQINKMVIGKGNNVPGYEIVLKSMKKDEVAWGVMHKKYHNSWNLPEFTNKSEQEREQIGTTLWVKFYIHRMKVGLPDYSCLDFEQLCQYVQQIKDLAKEYLEIESRGNEELNFIYSFYQKAIGEMKNVRKKIKAKMTEEDQITRNQSLIALYLNQAFVLIKLQRYKEAKNLCENALELDPDNLKGLFRLGVVCLELGIEEKAFNNLSKCLKREPFNQEFLKHKPFLSKFKTQKEEKKEGKKKFADKYLEEIEKDEKERILKQKMERKAKRLAEEAEQNKQTEEIKEKIEKGAIFTEEELEELPNFD